ncbi:hypothetical protein BGZ79_003996, partial [Entomortierella chlamydospora]
MDHMEEKVSNEMVDWLKELIRTFTNPSVPEFVVKFGLYDKDDAHQIYSALE